VPMPKADYYKLFLDDEDPSKVWFAHFMKLIQPLEGNVHEELHRQAQSAATTDAEQGDVDPGVQITSTETQEQQSSASGGDETNAAREKRKRFVPEWDEYFAAIAEVVSLRSKDQDHQVGAVIVGENGKVILSTGYNGLPRAIRENPARLRKRQKLSWTCHAEANAIFNAARCGTSLVGGTLYVTTFPCILCAQAIVQAGIRRVVCYGGYWAKPENKNLWQNSEDVFSEARITVDPPGIRREHHRWRTDRENQ